MTHAKTPGARSQSYPPAQTRSRLGAVTEAVAEVVWHEVGAARDRIHRARCSWTCDARIRFRPGLYYDGTCPCIDLYTEVLVSTTRYLSRTPPDAVRSGYGAMARAHCRRKAISDAERWRSGTKSLQKPEALRDGAAYAVLGPELGELLVDVVREACSDAPLDGELQLLQRLATRRAARSSAMPSEGGAAARLSQVMVDLAAVRTVVDRMARRVNENADSPDLPASLVSWWDFYVERPLGRRSRPGMLSLDAPARDVAPMSYG